MRKTRFTINYLSEESGLDRRTLSKLLSDVPTQEGGYTLQNFAEALLARTAIAKARLDKLQAEARIAQQTADENEGRLVDVADFSKAYEVVAVRQVAVIESSALSDEAKDEIRRGLSDACAQAAAQAKASNE